MAVVLVVILVMMLVMIRMVWIINIAMSFGERRVGAYLDVFY